MSYGQRFLRNQMEMDSSLWTIFGTTKVAPMSIVKRPLVRLILAVAHIITKVFPIFNLLFGV